MFNNKYKRLRVLVTGHTGFKGSWLSAWLIKLGAEVAGYSSSIPTIPSHFEMIRLSGQLRHFIGDIRDYDRLIEVFKEFKPEVVFHLAAQPIVSVALKSPKETFDINLIGSINVMEAVRNTPSVKAAVFITSDKCYENVEWEFGYRENDRLGGKDPYSASKACAEIALRSYYLSYVKGQMPLKMVTARAGNVIGGGDWGQDRVVPDCIRNWSENRPVQIRNPNSTRPWQHVLEPLSGYLWLGALLLDDKAGIDGEAFNFGPGGEINIPVSALLEKMRSIWGGGSWKVIRTADIAKKEASLLKLSCDKAFYLCGWVSNLTFEETVKMTMEWYTEWNREKDGNMAPVTSSHISKFENIALERDRVWAK